MFLFLVAEAGQDLLPPHRIAKINFLFLHHLSQRVGQKSKKCIEKFTDIWYYIK